MTELPNPMRPYLATGPQSKPGARNVGQETGTGVESQPSGR